MTKRTIKIDLRLSETEMKELTRDVKKAGISREAYLRSLIKKIPLKEQPSVDFLSVLKQLQQINNNMNQIASKANSIGFIDTSAYQENVDQLQDITAELLRAVMS